VSAVDLAPPAIAHFYLAVPSGRSVANHEMIREAVLHSAHVPMIIIEHACIALPCATVVHDDELPATPFHGRTANRFDD
jgi:hypothetical protein